MRVFLLAAIVLIIFAIIASTSAGAFIGVSYSTWLAAALLAYFLDLAFPLLAGAPRDAAGRRVL